MSDNVETKLTSRSELILNPSTNVYKTFIVRLTNRMALKGFRPIYMCSMLTSKFLNTEKLEDGPLLRAGMSCNLRKSPIMVTLSGTSLLVLKNLDNKVDLPLKIRLSKYFTYSLFRCYPHSI